MNEVLLIGRCTNCKYCHVNIGRAATDCRRQALICRHTHHQVFLSGLLSGTLTIRCSYRACYQAHSPSGVTIGPTIRHTHHQVSLSGLLSGTPTIRCPYRVYYQAINCMLTRANVRLCEPYITRTSHAFALLKPQRELKAFQC